MKERAYAKINLCLDVVGRRDDGYHELKMIMVPIDFYDVLEMNYATETTLELNRSYLPVNEKNTIIKAIRVMQEKYGFETPVDYMMANGMLKPSPSVGFAPPEDSLDSQTKRSDVNKQLCTYTWKMIFAKDEAEFESLWDEMVEKMDGFGYKELYEYDCGVYQAEVDAKKAVAGE